MESHTIIAGLNFLNMGRGDEIQKIKGGVYIFRHWEIFFHCSKRKAESESVDADKLIKLAVGS